MIRSLLIGLVAGLRSMTPLAAASMVVAAHPERDTGAPRLFGKPLARAGALAMAAGELLGDKWQKAPDRTTPPGLVARLITGGIAGAALAPRRDRVPAAVVGAAGAMLAGYVGLALRKRAMARYGQTRSGVVEDGITLLATTLLMGERR
ncbi:DUF4126 domain-containing protein [Brevundimonas sp.]|uniref:DUF4126 domain-containing protein n=1 Tax=Brevundimonas sp. TaxID=1871086 RepID=UPI0035AF4114